MSTTGKPNGYYGLEVDVRSQGSTATYDAVANLSYLVDACTANDSIMAISAADQRREATL